MDDVKKIFALVGKELHVARENFPKFNSSHEGYAVLKEEFDEVWEEIKNNNDKEAFEEMLQVAAMAIRFIKDCTNPTLLNLKYYENFDIG